MSDDRWLDENGEEIPPAMRVPPKPKGEYKPRPHPFSRVSAEEVDAFVEDFKRKFGIGKPTESES